MTDPNRAKRTGAKAPWPKGKPRNPVDARWKRLRARCVKALASVDRSGEAGSNVRSGAFLASLCGVTPSTVCKWLNGARNPPASAVDVVETWLKELK
jgi:hypothetical protein